MANQANGQGKQSAGRRSAQENHSLMQLYGLAGSLLRYDRLTLNQPNLH